MNTLLWIARTGAPWRDLPERLGRWNSQWHRFDRWAKRGVLDKVAVLLAEPEADVLILDSTVIRAHPCAAVVKKRLDGSGGQAEALVAGHEPEAVIADKGYDKKEFADGVERRGAVALIPSRSTNAVQRTVDWHDYRERSQVERFWSKAIHFRRAPPGTRRGRRTSSPSSGSPPS